MANEVRLQLRARGLTATGKSLIIAKIIRALKDDDDLVLVSENRDANFHDYEECDLVLKLKPSRFGL